MKRKESIFPKEMVCFGLLLNMIKRSLSSNSEGSSDLCEEAK